MRNNLEFAMLALLLLCSCSGSQLTGKKMSAVFLPPHTFSTTDSLRLVARTSDSVFTASQLGEMTDSGWIHLDSNKKNSVNIEYCIKNNSALSLILPLGEETIILCNVGSCIQGLGYRLGTVNGDLPKLWSTTIAPSMQANREGYFRVLQAGEESCPQAALKPLGYLYLDAIRPGRYWVQLVYNSSVWRDGDQPVWLGMVESDTVYFDIIP
jgi:hypothetical protein